MLKGEKPYFVGEGGWFHLKPYWTGTWILYGSFQAIKHWTCDKFTSADTRRESGYGTDRFAFVTLDRVLDLVCYDLSVTKVKGVGTIGVGEGGWWYVPILWKGQLG